MVKVIVRGQLNALEFKEEKDFLKWKEFAFFRGELDCTFVSYYDKNNIIYKISYYDKNNIIYKNEEYNQGIQYKKRFFSKKLIITWKPLAIILRWILKKFNKKVMLYGRGHRKGIWSFKKDLPWKKATWIAVYYKNKE